jgi:NADPH:quinone reductase-like Zn-dependent oxidoreductase
LPGNQLLFRLPRRPPLPWPASPLAGLTAWQCAERLNVSADSLVLVTGGAGGVGTMLIKLLLSRGIGRLVTTAGSEGSKRHLMELGLAGNRILNYRDPALLQSLMAATAGSKFDCCMTWWAEP